MRRAPSFHARIVPARSVTMMEYSVEDSKIELRNATCSSVPDSFKKRCPLPPRACSLIVWSNITNRLGSQKPGNTLRDNSANLQCHWESSVGSLHAEGCRDFADSFHESGGQIPRILPGGQLCHRRRERREDRAQRLVQTVVPGVEIAVPAGRPGLRPERR